MKIGIIGTAGIAKKYMIASLKKHASEVIIASRDPNTAREVANTFSISFADSYDALLIDESIEAVYIPLPIGLHKEYALAAAQAEKHILCEKSLSGNYSDSLEIIDTCKQTGVTLFENFMCEYHSQHEAIRNAIAKGMIGSPFLYRSSFGFPPFPNDSFRYSKKLGGGSLNDAGAYTAFMARKVFQEEPTAVTCILYTPNSKEVDIWGSATLEFSGGKVAQLSFGFNNVYQNSYSVWGENGLIETTRAFSIPPEMPAPVTLMQNRNFQTEVIELEISPCNHFDLTVEHFIATINNPIQTQEKLEDLRRQAVLLQAMRDSSSKRQKIDLACEYS